METRSKMKTKTKKENTEHKKPWQETYATPEEIKAMLSERAILRYNEVRGRGDSQAVAGADHRREQPGTADHLRRRGWGDGRLQRFGRP